MSQLTSPRRVLLVGLAPTPPEWSTSGGVHSAVDGLATGMAELGIRVRVVAPSRTRVPSPYRSRGGYELSAVASRKDTLLSLSVLIRSWSERLRFKPDVVHVHGSAIVSTLLPGSFLTIHGVPREESRLLRPKRGSFAPIHWKRSLYVAVEHWLIRRHSRLVSIADYIDQECGSSSIAVVPNALRETSPEPTAEPEPGRYLYVGRVIPRKRLDLLVRALAEIVCIDSSARLVIVGDLSDSEYVSSIKALAAHLGVESSIDWLGRQDSNRVRAEMVRAAALVLASDQETLPMVIAEALSVGLPVVSTNVGGCGEMLDDSSGRLVTPNDERAFALAMRNFIQRSSSDRWIGGSFSRSTRYSRRSVAEANVNAYGAPRPLAIVVGVFPPPVGGVTLSAQHQIAALSAAGLDARRVDVRHPTQVLATVFARPNALVLNVGGMRSAIACGVAARLHCRASIVLVLHANDAPVRLGRGDLLARTAMWLLSAADHVWVNNEDVNVPAEFLSVAEVVPLPVHLDVPNVVRDPFLLVTSAYEAAELYGVGICIEALSLLRSVNPKWRLSVVVYGEEGPNSSASQWQSAEGVSVLREGLGHTQFIELLASCSAYLRMTSTDGDSVAVRESIASGTPVIATNVVPRPDGCIVIEREVEALATAVLTTLDSQESAFVDSTFVDRVATICYS